MLSSVQQLALDISCAAEVARSATLSQRRGQWVLRKFVLGRPTDQMSLPAWLPWTFTSARLRLGAALAGNVAKLGLPQPSHHAGQSHPVQSEGIRDALRSGRLTPKPAISSLQGDRVAFVDGTSVPADLIVWATGYRVVPFLASESSTRPPTTCRCGTARSTPTGPACTSSVSCRPSEP